MHLLLPVSPHFGLYGVPSRVHGVKMENWLFPGLGGPNVDSKGTVSEYDPPPFWWFPLGKIAQTHSYDPILAALKGGRGGSRWPRLPTREPPKWPILGLKILESGFPIKSSHTLWDVKGTYLGLFGVQMRVVCAPVCAPWIPTKSG